MGMTTDGLSYWQAESEGIELLETTLGDMLDSRADELAAQEAVVYSCYPEFGGALDIRWSYAELRERVNAVARGLMALGLQKGEHIAVWAANLPEWVLLEFAAAKAGLVLVTVNPVYRAAEMTLHPLLAFDPLKTLQIIKQEGCALLFAVPTMLIAMLQHPEFETYKPTTLKAVTSGGAPVPVAVMEQVSTRMGTDVSIVFGQTESTGGITLTLPDDSFELKS